MIYEKIYSIISKDGKCVGTIEHDNENELCDIIKKENVKNNPISIHTIDVNRYYEKGLVIIDKLSNEIVMCYDEYEAQRGKRNLNNLNIEKERAEAKLRALKL